MLGPMTLIPSQDGVDRREEGTGLSRFLSCASVPWQVKEGKSWGQVLSVTQGERGGDRDTETDRNREDRQTESTVTPCPPQPPSENTN